MTKRKAKSTKKTKKVKTQTVYYTKTSSSHHAQLLDPITEYQLSLRYLNRDSINWEQLSVGDQRLQLKVKALTPSQLDIYHHLIELLRQYVDRTCGAAGFNDTSTLYIWNWPTWHKAILQLANSIVGHYSGMDDCWFSRLGSDRNGRSCITVRPSRTEKRWDVAFYKGEWLHYIVEGGTHITTSGARFIGVLFNGVPPTEDIQCSHLCHNNPQNCINPRHSRWETDRINKGRNYCTYGSGMYCPHQLKCVYSSLEGRFLPHRNLSYWAICDCEGMNCHTELCFVSSEETSLTSDLVEDFSTSDYEVASDHPPDISPIITQTIIRHPSIIPDSEDDSSSIL